jgi:hypothetical protein
MSNKRRLRRRLSALLTGFADAYSCGHCTATTRSTPAHPSVILLDVLHDPDCPVLNGLVEDLPDVLRALSSIRIRRV